MPPGHSISSSSSTPPVSHSAHQGSHSSAPGSHSVKGHGSSNGHPSSAHGSVSPSGSGGVHYCQPVKHPTCERSCGKGWVTCQEFPNCYNPGIGQSCCSDGSYCPAGSSCVPGGCCPHGESCTGGGSHSANLAPSSQIVAPGLSSKCNRSPDMILG